MKISCCSCPMFAAFSFGNFHTIPPWRRFAALTAAKKINRPLCIAVPFSEIEHFSERSDKRTAWNFQVFVTITRRLSWQMPLSSIKENLLCLSEWNGNWKPIGWCLNLCVIKSCSQAFLEFPEIGFVCRDSDDEAEEMIKLGLCTQQV